MGICGSKTKESGDKYLDDEVVKLRGKIRKQIEAQNNERKSVHVVTNDKFLNVNDAETIDNILNIFTFKPKLIGKGSFGSVMASKLKYYGDDFDTNPSTIYAIKVIKIDEPGLDEGMLNNEISMLKNCTHPNIINLYEIYKDDRYLYLVMENCPGGDLEDHIKKGRVKEEDAKNMFYQMLYGVNFLHTNSICHRDIKPGNFMFSDKSKNTIKLIDFGWSKEYAFSDLVSVAGSPYYVAPEIVKNYDAKKKLKYNQLCDTWSLGVTLYEMLSNKMPFDAGKRNELFKLILTKRLRFEGFVWEKISEDCKDLIRKLLEKDPKKRLTATEALNHKWFNSLQNQLIHTKSNMINKCKVENLKNFKAYSLFDKEILRIMVETNYNEPLIKDLSNIFWYLDYDCDGFISSVELRAF